MPSREASGRSWWADFLLSPQVLGAVAAVCAGAAAALGYLSARPDPAPAFAVPPSWIDLSRELSEADRRVVPPELAEALRSGALAAAAVERPLLESGPVEQVFVAMMVDEALAPDAGKWLPELARRSPFVSELPDGTVRARAGPVLEVGGVAVASARVETFHFDVFAYAVPFGPRSAVLFYTCGPMQCGRIQRISESAVKATGGIGEASILHSWVARRASRLLALLAAFGALAAGACAVWAARRAGRAGA